MEQKALIFGEDCINKNAFLKNKRPINIDEVDIGRIVLSKKYSNSNKGLLKYFTGYIQEGRVFSAPFYIKIHQINE